MWHDFKHVRTFEKYLILIFEIFHFFTLFYFTFFYGKVQTDAEVERIAK